MAKRGRPAQQTATFRIIADRMRDEILSGRWPDKSVIPSLSQLAASHGVGRTAVRMAVEVLKVEGHLESLPRRRLAVHAHAGASTDTNGIILQVFTANLGESQEQSDGMSMHFGVLKRAGKYFMPLYIVHSWRLGKDVPVRIKDLPLRGVIIFGKLMDKALRKWEACPVPVVVVDSPVGGRKLHSVAVDNKKGVEEALDRLVEEGHRRIAFLRVATSGFKAEDPDSKERFKAFQQGMRRRGLKDHADASFMATSRFHPNSPVLDAIFKARPRYTAVFTMGEGLAHTVIGAARHRGISVPRDLSVVGFQARRAEPKVLSGPAIDFAEMGMQAVDLIQLPKAPRIHRKHAPTWNEGGTIGPASN